MTGLHERNTGDDLEATAALFDFYAILAADRAEGVDRNIDEYVARFPEIEAAIREELTSTRGEDEARDENQPKHLGPYRLIRKLGSGGQGTVYLAEDTRLSRRVAVKLLAPHLDFVSSDRLMRFRREVEILATLDHPGICSVIEAATTGDVPYLVMPFVEGETLASWIRERRNEGDLPRHRTDQHQILRWISTIARTLHEAHEAGIVHRDIKPANIVLSQHDVPVILDFGIASHIDSVDTGLTRTGSVLGTLAYMAPEALRKRTTKTDRRVDVYALGVTLYECLTHKLPFEEDTHHALWHAIETGDATDVRQHNASLPRELGAVVMTAIAKSPGHRYATALDFAEDLARVIAREPIRARAIPAHLRALRMVQRHPTLSTMLATSFLMLGALAFALRESSRNERAASALNRALQAASSDEGAFEALKELVAAAGPQSGERMRSAILQVLDGCHLSHRIERRHLPPLPDPSPAIDHGRRKLVIGDQHGGLSIDDITSGRNIARRKASRAALRAVMFTADDQAVITTGDDGTVRVWPLANLDAPLELTVPGNEPLTTLGLSPNGTTLVAGGRGRLHFVATDTWQVSAHVGVDEHSQPTKLLFSPDGKLLLVLAREHAQDPDAADRAYVIDTIHGTIVQRLSMPEQEVLHAQWHATLPVIALAYNGGHVEVIEASSGKPRFTRETSREVHWCGFDPSGEFLLVPSDPATELWRWDSGSSRPERKFDHPFLRTIGSAAWSTDGSMLAAVHRDGTIVVRDATSWRVLQSFKQRAIDVRYLEWSRDDAMLLTADLEKVSVWHALVRPHLPRFAPGNRVAVSIATHGDLVLTGADDGQVAIRSVSEGRTIRELVRSGAALRRVRFDRSGDLALGASEDGRVRVFDATDGATLLDLVLHDGPVVDAWFADEVAGLERASRTVISIGDDGRTRIQDIDDPARGFELRRSAAPIRSAAFHPTKPLMAVGRADRWVTIWNIATHTLHGEVFVSTTTGDWRINPLHQVRGLCFDEDTGLLEASIVNNYLHTIEVADDGSTTILASSESGRYGGPLVFDKASHCCLAADYSFGLLTKVTGRGHAGNPPITRRPRGFSKADESIEPMRLATGAEAHSNRVSAVHVHPDGGVALSASLDGSVLVWDTASSRVLLSMRLDTAIVDACFTSDGSSILVSSFDGTVRSLPIDPLAAARAYLARRQSREGTRP
ncbi:MAG: protein kinase [Planctomycetes bacterium]|nr:protein kinase [Planctomycetota bacterium]MCB9917278.1 protein kinase [Planctomycetota bacterium]